MDIRSGFDPDFDGNWGAEDAWFGDKVLHIRGVELLYSLETAVVQQWHAPSEYHGNVECYRHNLGLWMTKSEEMAKKRPLACDKTR